MDLPTDRKYLESHEWHQIVGGTATIGITQQAADELTDVTYVSLPKVGDALTAGERFGEIESVKATSDLIAGVSGTVTEVNEALTGDPGLVNREPFTDGWMLKVAVTAEGEGLLSAADYAGKVGTEPGPAHRRHLMATLTVSDDVFALVDARMKQGKFDTPDALLKWALADDSVGPTQTDGAETYEDLDEQARDAIEEGEAEYRAGMARPWDEVRAELAAKYVDRTGQP